MASPQEIRYTAFIDILGFKQHVHAIDENPEKYETITAALTNLSVMDDLRKAMIESDHLSQSFKHIEEMQDLKIQIFSDCITISTADSKMGALAVTAMSALTYWILFSHGFFARGAISKDHLTLTDKLIFGKALITAYSLEQKSAFFPRIILDEHAFLEMGKHENLEIPIKLDIDGLHYLDVFHKSTHMIIERWNKQQKENKYHINLENGKNKLIDNLKTETETSSKQKLYWLKNYFNENSDKLKLEKIDN